MTRKAVTKKPVPETLVAKKRKEPSAILRDEVLREAGYKCGSPTCRHILTLELHHIVWVKDDGPTTALNLIALCPNCHSLHTHGQIPPSAIRHWKGLLHALNHAFSRESMDLLLYLHRETIEWVWYSGDGLLRFASLMAAGLVEVAASAFSVGDKRTTFTAVEMGVKIFTSPPTSSVRVKLSEKGRLLVGSWLKGDERTYAKALGYELPESEDE